MIDEKLEVVVGKLLREKGLTVALGESCTGGLIGHRLTNVAGSSDYFLGGVIAYAYDAKERLLGVEHNTLYEHGAVSAETASEMAQGARKALGSDVGISVTGIAGPGGGMPGKPVGLTYIALSARDIERVEQFVWDGERDSNKILSADAALMMLKEYLEQSVSA